MGANTSRQQPQSQLNLPRVTDNQGNEIPHEQQLVIHLLNYFPNTVQSERMNNPNDTVSSRLRTAQNPMNRVRSPIIVNPNTPSQAPRSVAPIIVNPNIPSQAVRSAAPIIVNPNGSFTQAFRSRVPVRLPNNANNMSVGQNGQLLIRNNRGQVVANIQPDQDGLIILGQDNMGEYDMYLMIDDQTNRIHLVDNEGQQIPLEVDSQGRTPIYIRNSNIYLRADDMDQRTNRY